MKAEKVLGMDGYTDRSGPARRDETARVWSWVVLATLLAPTGLLGSSWDAPRLKLQPVPFHHVTVTDALWAPRQATNRLASIPVNFENLAKAGNIRNLELAAAGAREGYTGPVFMDSDIYKALEAAAYSLATHPDAVLEERLEAVIATLAAAQQPDGYLNSYYTVVEPDRRWTNLRDNHELYCAGHLFEAAVAHYQVTGRRTFLDVATRLADNIDSVFGPGKRMGYPGHPEIELALVKLWQVTQEPRYLELARFFVENRGRQFFAEEHGTPLARYDGSYWQDDVPITEHRNIKGHAVRAAYLLSGVTDVAAETGDEALLRMIHRVWRNTAERNTYVTGGIGPSAHNEGFTDDYDLPNATAYQETCASVALAQWNHRMALLYGDARYADVVERALYNGVLAGVSLDGTRFFYVNPLENRGSHRRSEWFGCACCPPNVARTIASVGGYAYAQSDRALWVNLYIQGTAHAQLAAQPVHLQVTTRYPWDGQITLRPVPDRPTAFELRLRVPGWCERPTVTVNGERVADPVLERGYVVLDRTWQEGDVVLLDLPMQVRRVVAHPRVVANTGRVAFERGPIVYCFEEGDQSAPLAGVYVPASASFRSAMRAELLGGVVVLDGQGERLPSLDWRRRLYQAQPVPEPVVLRAIPYAVWANREAWPMKVWMPVAPPLPVLGGLETEAEVSLSFVSGNCHPHGINDGVVPRNSREHPGALCHWWPRRGTREWAQYSWKDPVTVHGSRVYWFDDTGHGACRVPVDWAIEYWSEGEWHPVRATSGYPVALDQWCETTFDPVTTTALRLQVQLQPDWAVGVHEWQVMEAEED
jgi:uncharacterized protein